MGQRDPAATECVEGSASRVQGSAGQCEVHDRIDGMIASVVVHWAYSGADIGSAAGACVRRVAEVWAP